MQKKTEDMSVIPFGRASQMVKRYSIMPCSSSPVRLEEEEGYANECSAVTTNCMADCSVKEDTDEVTSVVKRKNVRMVWMDDCGVRNCSITQLPHPSQLRKRRKQHYEKTKPLGWDFMSHLQQLHRKREEFESMKNDNINSGNFVPERNLMYVHVVRSQPEVPTDAEENALSDAQEAEDQDISALMASSPPRMRERSFNLFPFSEE